MADTALKLLIISDNILNAVSIRALPQPSLSHQPQDKNGKHHRKKREAKVERKLIKSSLLRLPNEIISMVFRMLAGESADEGATAAGVCFALTSKRIAQLAMQTRIILPKRLLLDEETFIRTHCQGHRQRSAPGMVLNTGPNALCSCTFGSCTCRSSWIPLSQVRREDCITVTTFHHKLMVALREWMPKGILYCAYCGRWTTLCKAHEETSLTVNTTDLPQFISTDHKPYVCHTCHAKGLSELHELRADYKILLLQEGIKECERSVMEMKKAMCELRGFPNLRCKANTRSKLEMKQ